MGKVSNKYNNLSVQAKAVIWFTLCNIIQKGISTITVPLFTRLMTTEQYGMYTVYLSWQSILLVFTSLNLYYGVFNNAMIKYQEDRDKYIASMQGLTFVITSFFFCFYIFTRVACNKFLGMNTLLVCLLYAQLLTMPPLLFWSARQRFEFRYKVLVVVTLLKVVLNTLLGIIAVLIYQEKDVARIVSIVIIEVLIGGIISILQFAKGRVFFHKEYWKYAFFFNFPLLPHYLSGTILNQSDRIMIDKLVGTTEVALYSVAYNIGMLMLLFTDAINNSFTPWMYIKMGEKKYKDIKEVGTVLISLIALLVIALLFFAPEVIWIFGSSRYANAIQVIPPVAVTTYFIFSYVLFANIEFYYEKNKMIMVASIAAAILNIILNAIFIPLVGYYAAAYTTLFCYILYTASHYFFSTVICKKQMNIKNIFDIKTIVFIGIALLCSIPLFGILYEHMILRYTLFIVFIVILYMKRATFLSSIKIIREKNN